MDNVLEQLRGMRIRKDPEGIRPHKIALLLGLADLYERDPCRPNRFMIDDKLTAGFIKFFKKLARCDDDSSAALIEYPFFHLQGDGFWTLQALPGMQSEFNEIKSARNMRFTLRRLKKTVSHASLSDSFDVCLRDADKRAIFVSELERMFREMSKAAIEEDSAFSEKKSSAKTTGAYRNEFVSYLNSLQRIGANNENALAEFQACNPQFAHIHIAHPLTEAIITELQDPRGNHVILTGHAGDGKSTIAFDVYKRLTGIPETEPLLRQLKPREKVEKQNISILKDLSERDRAKDAVLLQEIVEASCRFLLVSNTGNLLDLFRDQAEVFGLHPQKIESDVLTAISAEQGVAELKIGDTAFRVYNLARMDNLRLTRRVFEKMLHPDRWSECASKACSPTCPIFSNITVITANQPRIIDRLFLAYRRMYEYGTRLTMRQLTEHLAYTLTSGLEESDVLEMHKKNALRPRFEYMFFNRFFGDNGKVQHAAAQQMRAVSEVCSQGFGGRPSPTWERRLWLRSHGQNFQLGVSAVDAEFEMLRDHGARLGTGDQKLTPRQAREQVRRMLYFLYDFQDDKTAYLQQYLNSAMILRWEEWQGTEVRLDSTEKFELDQSIYHVLQEHFTGVRLPERSTQNDRRLYITLGRRQGDIKQSAQVVLAEVDWSTDLQLVLETLDDSVRGKRVELVLRGQSRIEGIDLRLTLPFLDYVVMRHFGEVGEVLQVAYLERLERFKARIQDRIGGKDERIMLIRLRTDHSFRRQYFTVGNGKLEVSDVL